MLRAENLSFRHPGGPLFEELSFELTAGELVCLLGPNGSGKSSLLRAVTGILPLRAGHVFFEGRDLASLSRRERARIMAYVPQQVPLAPISVLEALMLGRNPYLRFMPSAQDRRAVEHAVERMGIGHLRKRGLDELSGGERQKVLIGMALAQECPVLVLDEAASSLDVRYQLELYELLREECRSGKKLVLMAEHDLNLAATYGDKILMMHEGRLVASGTPAEALNTGLLREVYGVEARLETREGNLCISGLKLPGRGPL